MLLGWDESDDPPINRVVDSLAGATNDSSATDPDGWPNKVLMNDLSSAMEQTLNELLVDIEAILTSEPAQPQPPALVSAELVRLRTLRELRSNALQASDNK